MSNLCSFIFETIVKEWVKDHALYDDYAITSFFLKFSHFNKNFEITKHFLERSFQSFFEIG